MHYVRIASGSVEKWWQKEELVHVSEPFFGGFCSGTYLTEDDRRIQSADVVPNSLQTLFHQCSKTQHAVLTVWRVVADKDDSH
jgi:hypothetical protein